MTAPKTCPRGLHIFAGSKCPACARADAANAAALDELDEITARKWRRNRAGFLPPPESHPQNLFRRQREAKS